MSIRMRSNGKPRLAIRSRSASVGSALYVEGKMYLNGGAPNCLARSSIAATCSTKKGLYCSFPSSKALTLYGAACPSAARRRPHVVVVASPHAYSTRSAQSSASLASYASVSTGVMPSALHRSTYSNGPQPASRLRPHAWPLLGRVHGGPRQSFQRSDCDTVPPARITRVPMVRSTSAAALSAGSGAPFTPATRPHAPGIRDT
mmetsp:Transcript_47141/g.102390  ORF Transcript_47141/g.102390 Transcript_47141/m.102390 type:complete len:203 (+) Transcript_47141:939-1547(+)